ncbi:MAG: hypothetical protein HC850_18070 [Rhodomicrobium sp.]|nr:hypothetical protein [Rhodomicrobium sp.]
MLNFDFISVRSRLTLFPIADANLPAVFEVIFSLWISALAALVFLAALFLAIVNVISWTQLLYVYIGLTVFTLLLAALNYFSKTDG